jgi:hypothetical protein
MAATVYARSASSTSVGSNGEPLMRYEVWQWLLSLHAISPSSSSSSSVSSVSSSIPNEWPSSLLKQLVSGTLALQILRRLAPNGTSLSKARLEATPLARLQNWNEIVRGLSSYGIPMDPDVKTLIVAGDEHMAVDWLNELHRTLSATSRDGITPTTDITSNNYTSTPSTSAGSDLASEAIPDTPLRQLNFELTGSHNGSISISDNVNNDNERAPSVSSVVMSPNGGHLVLPPLSAPPQQQQSAADLLGLTKRTAVAAGINDGPTGPWLAWGDRVSSSWRHIRRWLINELHEQLPISVEDADDLLPHTGDSSWCPGLVDLYRYGHHQRFEPVTRWLSRISSQITIVIPMITDHAGLLLVLETLRPSLVLSPSLGVITATIEAIVSIVSRLPSNLVDVTWTWLTSSSGGGSDTGGLAALLSCYRRHIQSSSNGSTSSMLRESIFRFITSISDGHLFELFAIHLQKVISCPAVSTFIFGSL